MAVITGELRTVSAPANQMGAPLESDVPPGPHQGRHRRSAGPGLSGLSAPWREAGGGAGKLVDGPGRPLGRRSRGGGDRDSPAAGSEAQTPGAQGPRRAGASGPGLTLSMVLPTTHSCARGQRTPPPPSAPRRRSWLTPGRQPRKPDGYSALLGTGQNPGGTGAGEGSGREKCGEEGSVEEGRRTGELQRREREGDVWSEREEEKGRTGRQPERLPGVQTFFHADCNSAACRTFAASPSSSGPLPRAFFSLHPLLPGLVFLCMALTP